MLYPEFKELVSYKNLKLDGVNSYRNSHSQILGGQHSPFRGQGLEFDSVRKYVPGDDIRNIDWKVTARTGSPHLKIFQEDKQRHIILCMDMNSYMQFGTRNTFKSVQAARIAAILGWQGLARQDRVSACLFGDVPEGIEFFTPKHKSMSFFQLLKRFCEPCLESHSVPFIEAFRRVSQAADTGALVYFISDFLNMGEKTELEALFNRLKQKCNPVFISINDPADKALIAIGKITLSSYRDETFIINTDSSEGREAYALQWKQNRDFLYQKMTRFGIPLIELTTEDDIKKDLLIALKSLSTMRLS